MNRRDFLKKTGGTVAAAATVGGPMTANEVPIAQKAAMMMGVSAEQPVLTGATHLTKVERYITDRFGLDWGAIWRRYIKGLEARSLFGELDTDYRVLRMCALCLKDDFSERVRWIRSAPVCYDCVPPELTFEDVP